LNRTLEQLIELQEIDTRLSEIAELKGDLPQKVKKLTEQIEEIKSGNAVNSARIEEIEKEIRPELKPLFNALSPLRRFNSRLLEHLQAEGFIQWPGHEYELQDRLLQTYLVENDGGYLKDEITRRLFAIRQRKSNPKKFAEVCNAAMAFYISKLEQRKGFLPHVMALGILFLKLQLGLGKKDESKLTLPELSKLLSQLLDFLRRFDDALDIIDAFQQKLQQDWELKFNFTYLFPNASFKDFTDEISKFRKKLVEGYHD